MFLCMCSPECIHTELKWQNSIYQTIQIGNQRAECKWRQLEMPLLGVLAGRRRQRRGVYALCILVRMGNESVLATKCFADR